MTTKNAENSETQRSQKSGTRAPVSLLNKHKKKKNWKKKTIQLPNREFFCSSTFSLGRIFRIEKNVITFEIKF